jgi:hypothetical protein
MPRFKDEMDFPDPLLGVGRPLSNEVVRNPKISRRLVNEPEAGSLRQFDIAGSVQANRLPSLKDPKVSERDESVEDDTFTDIARPSDGRRTMDKRSKAWPSTVWGNNAQTDVNNRWVPVFRAPGLVLPCIERQVRREVLFARRRAGRGGAKFPRRKRPGPWSSMC